MLERNIHRLSGHLHEVGLSEVGCGQVLGCRLIVAQIRSADFLTHTILKSQAAECGKVLYSARLAKDPHPSILWLPQLLVCCLCMFTTTFPFLPEGNRRERVGDTEITFQNYMERLPTLLPPTNHWLALGHTWRQQVKSTDCWGSHPNSATCARGPLI